MVSEGGVLFICYSLVPFKERGHFTIMLYSLRGACLLQKDGGGHCSSMLFQGRDAYCVLSYSMLLYAILDYVLKGGCLFYSALVK